MSVDRAGIAAMQGWLIDTLTIVDATARSVDVDYFLAYGTALGARRHKAPIPWDTDADILVRWAHYSRLTSELAQRLPAGRVILTPEADSTYEYLFARIAPSGEAHPWLHLDLFPITGGPTSAIGQRIYYLAARAMNRAYFIKKADARARGWYGPLKRSALFMGRVMLCWLPGNLLLHTFRALQGRFDSSPVVTNPCGTYGLREFLPATWIDGRVSGQLSGQTFPLPASHDAVLEHWFGDFLTPVSTHEQQVSMEFATDHYVAPLVDAGVLGSSN